METSTETKELFAALLKFQSMNLTVKKDAQGNRNKYANIDSIMKEIRPKLSQIGLIVIQSIDDSEENKKTLTTRIVHAETSQFIASVITMPSAPLNGGKNDAQEFGSAITYCRRYCLGPLLGLATDEDDDAASVGKAKASKKEEPKPTIVTQNDIASLMAEAAKHGWTDEMIKQDIKKAFKAESKKDLTVEQCKKMKARMAQYPVKKAQ